MVRVYLLVHPPYSGMGNFKILPAARFTYMYLLVFIILPIILTYTSIKHINKNL